MLSDREKRLIEVQGFMELAKETIEELLAKEAPLDEFEKTLLRSSIEDLRLLQAEAKKLKKGK